MNKRDQVQQDALDIAVKHKRCGLAISMGVGKTLIGLRYMNYLQELSMHKLNVLVVAPKLSIFDSWRSDAENFNIDISKVKFSTYLSLNKLNPHHFDVVILDECHSLLNVHELFLSNYGGKILGLTGTPPRYANSEKGEMVMKYCPIVFNYITDTAVEDNILNNYQIIVHRLSLNTSNTLKVSTKKMDFYTSEQKNYHYWTKRLADSKSKKETQITSIMRMRALMDYKTKEKYAKSLLEDIEDKCIVFCNTQAQADSICIDSYHSENPYSEENLDRFKKGQISKLSCVLQLNEGVNIPDLRAGIILHAYGNERKSSQRIGRLLRLNPTDTAIVHILCYKDTVDEKWVNEALKDLDSSKVKYFNVVQENVDDYDSALYR